MAIASGDDVYMRADPGTATFAPASVGVTALTGLPATIKGAYFDVSAGSWTTEKTLASFAAMELQAVVAALSGGEHNLEVTPEGPASGDDVYLYVVSGAAAFNPASIGIQIQSLPAVVRGAYFNVSVGGWTNEVEFEFFNVIPLTALIGSQSTLSANLLANEGLISDIGGSSAIAGNMSMDMPFTTVIVGQSAISAELVRIIQVEATIAAESGADVSLQLEMALQTLIPSLSAIVGGEPKPLASDGLIFYNAVELAPSDAGRTFLVTLPVIINTAIDLSPED